MIVHLAVELDLELELVGVLGERRRNSGRLFAPLLAEQKLGKDEVDRRLGVVAHSREGVQVVLGGHPLTEPASLRWSTRKAMTISSGPQTPACSR